MAEKQVFKNKDEVIAELKNNAVFMDKLKFIKERFYPALCEATNSIEDAQQLLSGWNTQVMQEFLAQMKKAQMKDLDLITKLDAANPKWEQIKVLVHLFDELNVYDAKDYIEGMRSEIGEFLGDELRTRPLSSLKTKWLDEI